MADKKLQTINIKGKNYVQVNERLKAFRTEAQFAGWSLKTIVHAITDDVCVMEAQIFDKDGRLIGNGFAREVRTQAGSMVNATSYVENCETSAWGRALGNIGIGIDDAICSAQELLVAIGMQQSEPAVKPAPMQNKGGAIYPAKEPEPVQEDEEKADEFTALLADLQSVESSTQLVTLMKSERVQKSPYVAAILRAGHNYAKEKGWEK